MRFFLFKCQDFEIKYIRIYYVQIKGMIIQFQMMLKYVHQHTSKNTRCLKYFSWELVVLNFWIWKNAFLCSCIHNMSWFSVFYLSRYSSIFKNEKRKSKFMTKYANFEMIKSSNLQKYLMNYLNGSKKILHPVMKMTKNGSYLTKEN